MKKYRILRTSRETSNWYKVQVLKPPKVWVDLYESRLLPNAEAYINTLRQLKPDAVMAEYEF